MLKKVLIGLAGLFTLLLLALWIAPKLFKKQIKEKILEEADRQVEAEINFTDISISSFANFPQLTFTFHDFLIMGKDAFAGDTLAYAQTLELSFDAFKLMNGGKMKIKSVALTNPFIHVQILKDGRANYNIALPDSSAKPDTSHFEIDVDKWIINNGKIIYDDKLEKIYMGLSGVNHNGNGDFTQDVSDLKLGATVDEITYVYNDITYLHRKRFKADLLMEVDLSEYKFTFKDHLFEINHFKFGFDGYFKILKQGYEVDMKFDIKETSFKSLLSILPGYYHKDFDKIKTSGEFECNGHVKGIYNDATNSIPAFFINIKVKDGMFKYDHLPKAIENIQMHLVAENTDGKIGNTLIDLKHFHLDMDKNPVNGRLKIKGVEKGMIDAEIKIGVNLAEIEKMYPMEGIVLKGMLNADIKAKGAYDDSLKIFPVVDARFILDSGYVSSKDYPVPMEHISVNAEVVNKTGKLEDTRISLYKAAFVVDGEPVSMNGSVSDLTNFNYDFNVKGHFDFDKLTNIYPIKSTTVTGTLDIAIETKGNKADLLAKRYGKLQTDGMVEFKNVKISSASIAQPIAIDDAYLNFTPDKIVLERFDSHLGKCNVSITGHLFNYISFIADNTSGLKGDMEMYADSLNLNDWMSNSSTPAVKDTTKSNLQVMEVPKNLDFTFDSDIKYLRFDRMDMENLKGEIKIKDGIMTMNETGFNAADASFSVSGDYDTRDMKHPLFDLTIDIEKLDINKAYDMFGTVQAAAPAAEKTDGLFSTKYKLKGELAPDFQPIYESITGKGTIVIEAAEIKGLKVLSHVSKITKKKDMSNPVVKDIVMETEIKGGKILIKPFSFQISKFVAELEGTHTFTNTMNYILKISIPPFNKLKIPFHITGSTDKPIVKLGKGHENFDFDQVK